MNFLALAVKLRQECEVPGTGPAAVTGQVGQLKRIVDWTADAWEDIQNQHTNWLWMRRAFTLNTVLNDDSYAFGDATDVDAAAAITRFSHWLAQDPRDPYLCYLQSSGVGAQYRLSWVPWPDFKQLYRVGSQTNGAPAHVSADPQRNLVLGPKPNGVFVVTGDFQRSQQTLAADADIPEMPTQFHKLIVYWSMMKYGANSVATEIYSRAMNEANRMMRVLETNQLPEMPTAGPLA
jgi:hypothetical protein